MNRNPAPSRKQGRAASGSTRALIPGAEDGPESPEEGDRLLGNRPQQASTGSEFEDRSAEDDAAPRSPQDGQATYARGILADPPEELVVLGDADALFEARILTFDSEGWAYAELGDMILRFRVIGDTRLCIPGERVQLAITGEPV